MSDSREQTKKDLVQAFWTLYRSRDLKDITVTDVTQKAGYHRTTFYKYFNSIEDIMVYVQNLMMPAHHRPEHGFPVDRIMYGFVDTFLNAADYLVDLTGPGGDTKFYEAHMSELKNFMLGLEAHRKELDDAEYALIYECFYAGFMFSLHRWYDNYRDRLSEDKVKKLLAEIYEQGFIGLLTGDLPPDGLLRTTIKTRNAVDSD